MILPDGGVEGGFAPGGVPCQSCEMAKVMMERSAPVRVSTSLPVMRPRAANAPKAICNRLVMMFADWLLFILVTGF